MYEAILADHAHLDDVQRELIEITWRMLEAIHTGDVATYARFSAPELSCYEDVCQYRIDGLEFHTSMIKQMSENAALRPARFDLLTPRVQVYEHTGIVTYTRLMTFDEDGKPRWATYNETRVFVKRDDRWQMVHFHRSRT